MGVSTYILIVNKIGCRRYIECHRICIFHLDRFSLHSDTPTFILYLNLSFHTDSTRNTFMVFSFSSQYQSFVPMLYLMV